MILPSWLIVLIVLLCLLFLLVFIWIGCEIDTKHEKKKNLKILDELIYKQECQKAETTLATLQQATLASSQPATVVANYTYHTSVCDAPHVLKTCAGPNLCGTPPTCTSNFVPYCAGNAPMTCYGHSIPAPSTVPLNYSCDEPLAIVGYTEPERVQNLYPHLRIAETEKEFPSSMPPIAPPGYRTVPIVVENPHPPY